MRHYSSYGSISMEKRIVNKETGGEKGQKTERYDLIPMESMDFIARVFGMGAEKYEAHNWRRGYDYGLSYGAAMRHLSAFWQGENNDPESGEPHLAHAAFHMMALLYFTECNAGFDDRPTVTLGINEDPIKPLEEYNESGWVKHDEAEDAQVTRNRQLMQHWWNERDVSPTSDFDPEYHYSTADNRCGDAIGEVVSSMVDDENYQASAYEWTPDYPYEPVSSNPEWYSSDYGWNYDDNGDAAQHRHQGNNTVNEHYVIVEKPDCHKPIRVNGES